MPALHEYFSSLCNKFVYLFETLLLLVVVDVVVVGPFLNSVFLLFLFLVILLAKHILQQPGKCHTPKPKAVS